MKFLEKIYKFTWKPSYGRPIANYSRDGVMKVKSIWFGSYQVQLFWDVELSLPR